MGSQTIFFFQTMTKQVNACVTEKGGGDIDVLVVGFKCSTDEYHAISTISAFSTSFGLAVL